MPTEDEKQTDPTKVLCSGKGLTFGYISRPIYAYIDTRKAGPGELTVYCEGPHRNAICELSNNNDGTFALTVQAQDTGKHKLYIKYDGKDVPGSPYTLRVSGASLLRLRGPGIQDGLLDKHKGDFMIETTEAGPGEIKIRVGGPQGSFKVRTKREGKNLLCTYDPKQPGIYVINVLWSGDPVPGSPFRVLLANTQSELDHYKSLQSQA